jgi:hypothetical protein
MLRYSLVVVAALSLVGPAGAASWADSLFSELSKDFGSVPKGPTLSHPFRIVNKTGRVVVLNPNVRVSCGCVTATLLKTVLNPGEETAVVAEMDTRRVNGSKTVTIWVQFQQPGWDEVRLWVQANSRDDVTVSPDTLAFGHTKRGASPVATVTVTFLGYSESQILDVSCESNYVLTVLKLLRRTDDEVTYELAARIRGDAPVGKWYTDIWLKTNNPSMPRVRVPLTVEIDSALSISPALVALGQLRVGAETERKVIVRGVKPFRITAVRGDDKDLRVRDSTSDSKPVHVLTVTYKGARPGDLERIIHVVTDLPDESEIEFQARVRVVP